MPTLRDRSLLQALCAVALSFAPVCVSADLLPPSPLPPRNEIGAPRNIVVVSDLHMGVGHDPANPAVWHPTEDFRWHEEFADFLDAMQAAGKGHVDLVLAGDILELWQSAKRPPDVQIDTPADGGGNRTICALLDKRPHRKSVGDCDHPDLGQDFGCNEAEAVRRASRVVSEHRRVFEALGSFAMKGQNRVTLVPGNHDVALAFEGVREVVLAAIPHQNEHAEDQRVRIATEGYWLSADGRVLVEHGQQIGADPNRFDNWPTAPFKYGPDGTPYLKQPWGEELVQQLFNCVEHDYSTIDNLSSESAGLKYGYRDQGPAGAIRLVGRFVRFLLFQNSFAQAGQFLDNSKVPGEEDLKLDEIQAELTDDHSRWLFLAQSLAQGDPVRAEMEGALDELGPIDPFTTEEIVAVCGQRWLANETLPDAGIELCPVEGDLSFVAAKLEGLINPRARRRRFRRYLNELSGSLPATARPSGDFDLYVFGHTHREEVDYRPFKDGAKWAPVVYNDGAWQRTASGEVFCTILQNQDTSEEEALRKTRVEDLPACYPFVTIGRDADGNPAPSLFYWIQKDANSPGDYAEACTELPKIHELCNKQKAPPGKVIR